MLVEQNVFLAYTDKLASFSRKGSSRHLLRNQGWWNTHITFTGMCDLTLPTMSISESCIEIEIKEV